MMPRLVIHSEYKNRRIFGNTFLDNYRDQLKDKVLYPFCTSYESPMSEADTNLQKGYPDLNWKTGLRLSANPDQIKAWINQ